MATLDNIQSGSFTLAAADLSDTVTITAVVLAESVLRYTFSSDGQYSQVDNCCGGYLSSTTAITFTRPNTGGTDADIVIKWYVAEYSDGVTVQRGQEGALNAGTTNKTITAVTVAESWAFLQQDSTNHWHIDGNQWWTAKITSTTNLEFDSDGGDNSWIGSGNWQVVEYDNATVTSYTQSTDSATSANKTITAVSDLDKTMLVGSMRSNTGEIDCDELWNAYLSSTTNIAIARTASYAETDNFGFFVVEFSDNIKVHKHSGSMGTSATSANVTVSLTDYEESYLKRNIDFQASFASPTSGSDGIASVTYASMTSDTNVTVGRVATNSTATIFRFEIVEFIAATGVDVTTTKTDVEITPYTHLVSISANAFHTKSDVEITSNVHAVNTGANAKHTKTDVDINTYTHAVSIGVNAVHVKSDVNIYIQNHNVSIGVNSLHIKTDVEINTYTHAVSIGVNATHTKTDIEISTYAHSVNTGVSVQHIKTNVDISTYTHTAITGVNVAHTKTDIEITPYLHSVVTGVNVAHVKTNVIIATNIHSVTSVTGVSVTQTKTDINIIPYTHLVYTGVNVSHTKTDVIISTYTHSVNIGINATHTKTNVIVTSYTHIAYTGVNVAHTMAVVDIVTNTHSVNIGIIVQHTKTNVIVTPYTHSASSGGGASHTKTNIDIIANTHSVTAIEGITVFHVMVLVEIVPNVHTFVVGLTYVPPERTLTIDKENRTYLVKEEVSTLTVSKENRTIII